MCTPRAHIQDIKRQAGPKKNWPACYHIIRHHIAEDIPPQMHSIVCHNYYAYL